MKHFCFDNMALFEILNKTSKHTLTNFENINQILAQVIIGITACLRFPGQLNMDLRKLAVNMIPFPMLHFLTTSFSPLQTQHNHSYKTFNEHNLIKQMFEKTNQMFTSNSYHGKYLTATGIFRGKSLSIKVLHDLMIKEKMKQNFISWIPNNVRRKRIEIQEDLFKFSVKSLIVIFHRKIFLNPSRVLRIIRG